jgi:hypothetical protein
MQWYKIHLLFEQPPFGDALDYINHLAKVIHYSSDLKTDDVGIFSKMLRDGSLNVYFSKPTYDFIKMDISKFNPIKCDPPSRDNDEEGNNLRLHWGNAKLLL